MAKIILPCALLQYIYCVFVLYMVSLLVYLAYFIVDMASVFQVPYQKRMYLGGFYGFILSASFNVNFFKLFTRDCEALLSSSGITKDYVIEYSAVPNLKEFRIYSPILKMLRIFFCLKWIFFTCELIKIDFNLFTYKSFINNMIPCNQQKLEQNQILQIKQHNCLRDLKISVELLDRLVGIAAVKLMYYDELFKKFLPVPELKKEHKNKNQQILLGRLEYTHTPIINTKFSYEIQFKRVKIACLPSYFEMERIGFNTKFCILVQVMQPNNIYKEVYSAPFTIVSKKKKVDDINMKIKALHAQSLTVNIETELSQIKLVNSSQIKISPSEYEFDFEKVTDEDILRLAHLCC